MTMLEFERNRMIATLVLVAAMFASSAANSPSGPQSYGGYNQQQQMHQQQYQPQQQQDRWHAEVSPTSYVAETSASSTESKTPSEGIEQSPLPEGWSEHFDPNSNQYYYYNSADGTTSWDRPEPPATPEQKVVENEPTEDSLSLEPKPENAEAASVLHNPEHEREQIRQDPSVGGFHGMDGKDTVPGPSSEYESWESNKDLQMKQPESIPPSKIQPQPTNWGGHGHNDRTQTNDHEHPQSNTQQSSGSQWAHLNSTEPSVVGGESDIQKSEFQGQPPHTQDLPGQSSGWGMPRQAKNDDLSQKPVGPWGVQKPPEPRYQQDHMAPQKLSPPTDLSKDNSSNNERWEQPTSADKLSSNDGTQNTDSSYNQRQPWQESHLASRNDKSPDSVQRPPLEGVPPHANRGSQQPYPPRPHYLSMQNYPPRYGSYNPNTPQGQGQYDPKYGGQNLHGRGYPTQQPPHSQPNSSGQLVSQGPEVGTSTVKEALSSTWKGLLGFGSKTREVVGTARDQVVTGATAAGQSLSAKSSSIWESAKSTVGGVFENNESSQSYSLSGHNMQSSPDNRPSYPGSPNGPNQGYPSVPGGPGGRRPPPRTFGGPQQQPGRYGPQVGQQSRYSGPPQNGSIAPPGREQSPTPYQQSQHMRPPGYPNMQPRRDPPYPQTPTGLERGPMQSQYANQSSSQQSAQGTYQVQQRSPYSAPPQPDRGQATTQSTPQQQQQPDPWDHPGLTGEY